MWVLRRLRKAGFEALFAGGCVRDMLLGRRCSDYDVATNATPRQVRRLFRRVLLIGAKFGVAMVVRGGRKIEVATFRSDASYSDGRRPDAVTFTGPREDALRRDFTINGMFYDPISRQVIDHVGGRRDLQRGLVRTIGPARRRFAEDYLRMLRAVRFTVRFGFELHPATAAAVRKHASRIASISGERIFDELTKMLSVASAPRALRMMAQLNLAGVVLEDVFAQPQRWAGAVDRVGAVAARRDFTLTLAALLVDLPPKAMRRMVRKWGGSNELRDAVCWLAEHYGAWRRAVDMPLCDFKRLAACGQFGRLRRLWRHAERAATGGCVMARRTARRVGRIDPRRLAPAPLVTGEDLKGLGLEEGPALGRVLGALYDAQLNETLGTRRAAMAAARSMVRGSAESSAPPSKLGGGGAGSDGGQARGARGARRGGIIRRIV